MQVPDSKFPGSRPGNGQTIVFSRRPSELWNLELGTWSLDVAASQSKFQTPLGPTADSKFPGPTSRRAPRNNASSKRPLSEGKFHGSRSFRGQVPSSGTVMALGGATGSFERYFHSTPQEQAVETLNTHFPRLRPSGTSHYRVKFRSSGGASSNWKGGITIIGKCPNTTKWSTETRNRFKPRHFTPHTPLTYPPPSPPR